MFDLFNAFRENIQRKIKTPFLSAVTGVFIIHNWRLFFYPFFWGNDLSLYTKQSLYAQFFANAFSPESLWEVGWKSFVTIAVTYILMWISRAIVMVFENYGVPFLNDHLKGENVDKARYDREVATSDTLRKERDALKERVRNYDHEVVDLRKEKATIESDKAASDSKIRDRDADIAALTEHQDKLVAEHDNEMKALQESMDKQRNELESAVERWSEAVKVGQALEARSSQMTDELGKLNNERVQLRERLNKLETELEGTKTQLLASKQELSEQKKVNATLIETNFTLEDHLIKTQVKSDSPSTTKVKSNSLNDLARSNKVREAYLRHRGAAISEASWQLLVDQLFAHITFESYYNSTDELKLRRLFEEDEVRKLIFFIKQKGYVETSERSEIAEGIVDALARGKFMVTNHNKHRHELSERGIAMFEEAFKAAGVDF